MKKFGIIALLAAACGGKSGPPAAPSALGAVAHGVEITTQWEPVDGATGYRLYRSADANSGFVGMFETSINAFADATVDVGTRYYYKVRAVNAAGESPDSNGANAIPSVSTQAPAPPGSLSGVIVPAVKLTWSGPATAQSYVVLRSDVSGTGWTQIGNETTTEFVDLHAQSGSTYYYVVRAGNTFGLSPNSNEISLTAP